MSFGDQLRSFSPVAVIIDDGFAPVSLDLIDADDWASLRDTASGKKEAWASIQAAHFPKLKSVMDLKRDGADLAQAWTLYEEKPDEFTIFDPIFKKIVAKKQVAILPLRAIIEFLREEIQLTVCCHPNIPSAADDIKRAKLLFLDFYLYQQSTASRAIEDIREFNDLLSSKVEENGSQRDRFLFLISTQLPLGADIESFRKAAKVKAAFFKPIPKTALNKEWLTSELERRLLRYDDLNRLSSYLDVFSKQMERVTDSLRIDLEALELHDLAILDHMRLKVDSEDLGTYMSWLMSEALAARIRASAPMLVASQAVSAVNRSPLHGMLSPNQVLFELFSEISFSIPNQDSGIAKIGFGDVFLPAPKKAVSASAPPSAPAGNVTKEQEALYSDTSGDVSTAKGTCAVKPAQATQRPETAISGPQAGQELLLVIAPACDLQRIADDYDVLCVRGKVASRTPKLVDLLEQKVSLGKDNVSGGYKNLLRMKDGVNASFLLLEWYPERITTVLGTQLQGTAYTRLARLNELFGQEVKEDALRQVGRIGVPVDPAFSIGLGATIAYTVRKKGVVYIEIPDEHIISGVFTSGNSNNPPKIILSEEFLEYLDREIAKIDGVLTDVIGKFSEARAEITTMAGQGLSLASNERKLAKGKFTIRYLTEFLRDSLENGFCGVCFYPRGMIKDKPEVGEASAVTHEVIEERPAPAKAPRDKAVEVKIQTDEANPIGADAIKDKGAAGAAKPTATDSDAKTSGGAES